MDEPNKSVKIFKNESQQYLGSIDALYISTLEDMMLAIKKHLGKSINYQYAIFNYKGMQLCDDSDISTLKAGDYLFIVKNDNTFHEKNYMLPYKIEKVLGEGGFGSVYLATSRINKEKVAIKFIKEKPNLSNLLKEMQVLAKMHHPYIIQLHHSFMYDNAIALVMEYASGGELRDYIDTKKSLSEDETRNIFNQLVSAMCFCHSMKVVHRDLKLENILFSTEKKDQIKIVDFGISGYYDIEDKTNAGSLRYLPPEIISQTRLDANPAIDVWSMGCILYYLVNGRHPFSSKESKELKEKIKKGAYEIPQGNSFYLKALIRRMLDIDFHSRITLDEVMQHPWFLGETPPPITLNATPIQTHVGANHHKTLTKPSLINNGEPKYQSFASFKSKMNYRTNYTGFYHRDKDDPINEYSLYHCALDIPQFRRPIHHTKEQKRHLNMIFEITKKRAPSLCIYATTDGNNHNTKSTMKMRNTAYSKWGKNKHVIIK